MDRIAKSPPPELFQFATDAWTQPWWDAAREHRLTACRCAACGTFRMPPSAFCATCRSQATQWPTLSGRGIIFSFTVIERAVVPAMQAHIPYAPAVIELPDAGGVRMISAVIGAPLSAIRIGAEVSAVWEDHETASLLRFTLASGQGAG